MLTKSRLKKIADFVSNDGMFPTNIVVNFEHPRHLRFDQGKQAGDETGGTFGWLNLSPAYGSAWIIDGQHRLFAYSGHERAETSYLNVLAFEALPAATQTQLFVDINSEQRRVRRSLLVELDSTLKWDSEDESKRVHAIISKAGMALDEDGDSCLKNRILLADVRRTPKRCVSLTSVATALGQSGFFIVARRKGVVTYGPLWRDDPKVSLIRTITIIKGWLNIVSSRASEWWELGAEDGGGLAMNDGVTISLGVLRSVFEHLGHEKLRVLDDSDLLERIKPYGTTLGDYFGRMSDEERVRFRRLRGGEGHIDGTRQCQLALQQKFAKFEPSGLVSWTERRKANTKEQARQIIERIEQTLQRKILEILKEAYDLDDDAWFFEGVPLSVRKKVDERINEMGGGAREESFNFIHYDDIIRHNWHLLKDPFAFGPGNVGKEKGTRWLKEVNNLRNKVMHPSRDHNPTFDELGMLGQYEEWLDGRLSGLEDDVGK